MSSSTRLSLRGSLAAAALAGLAHGGQPPQIRVTRFQPPSGEAHPSCQVAAMAAFTRADGTVTWTRITLFQTDDGRIGAGVYPTPRTGAVLRWDHGPASDPTLIHWQAPHCPDDQCGSPCAHHQDPAS